MDKRAAVVLAVIFGGLFLVLFGFMLLAYSAVKSATFASDLDTTGGARVAIVEAKGTIGDLQNGVDADKIVKLLKKYEKDDDIKAIVLRVDSPGGSVAPSQEIHDAVKRIKSHGKKVVVSMGGLAASGGYYISAPADRIYAEPGTLTGSIGVIFMHFNVRGLLDWAKVEETTLKTGKYKDTLSPFRGLQDTDREEIQSISDDIYSQFVKAVAEGRIYTGSKAKELKLVDDLGGLDDAVASAWQMAGQTGEPKVQYPPKEHELSLRDLMRGAFQGAAEGVRSQVPEGGMMFLAPSLMSH